MEGSNWSRRKLLACASTAAVSALAPRGLHALPADPTTPTVWPLPFSRFTDIAAQAGLTQTMVYGFPDHATYIIENIGGGCAFFDYDNDGWVDIFLTSGRHVEDAPPGATNRLYKNNRNGTFTDVTRKAGLLSSGWASGVCVGDYNNDGFEDLFVTFYGQNRLYRNNGDGTFTDVTAKAGLLQPGTPCGTGCTFIDYNRDGLLDLFISNYVDIDLATTPKPSLEVPNCGYEGVPVLCGPRGLRTARHYLYRNNGDGTFTDVSKESGVAAIAGTYGLSVSAFDADEDGWPDIFVACDSTPSLLLMNNHDGTFREEGLLRGVAVSSDGQEMSGMGIGLGDYDLDGHTDILKTHFQHQASGLYHNNGKAEFEDVTLKSGIELEQRFISWGCGITDLDNDGYPDILIVCGTIAPELEKVYPKYPARDPRLVFRNRGDGTFVELGDETGPGISAHHQSRGCAFGDFDNDGDLDVLILNQNEPPSLLRNDAPSGNHWIKVRLEGVKSNRSAIGARVVVRYGGKVQVQEVLSQASYLSSNDPRLHFGLGAATTADIEVRWPLGLIEGFHAVAANRLITVREGQGIVKGRPFR